MPATSKKLTVREVQNRVKIILGRRFVSTGEPQWADPEDTQRLIDQLREDVIQAIAEGHKAPLALSRCIVELPRVHYGTIPVEPARTSVEKVAASNLPADSPATVNVSSSKKMTYEIEDLPAAMVGKRVVAVNRVRSTYEDDGFELVFDDSTCVRIETSEWLRIYINETIEVEPMQPRSHSRPPVF